MAREVEPNDSKSTEKPNGTAKNKSFPFSTQSNDKDFETKSIDLVSVNSELSENEKDNISIVDGYMQRWNFLEFRCQFLGTIAAIIILFGCSTLNSWSINEYLKLIVDIRNDAIESWNFTEYHSTEYAIVDEIFTSEIALVSAIIISYNVGVIFGGVFGAFIVPVLLNQVVYFVAMIFLFLGGFSLMMNGSVYYFVKGRFLIGLAHGITELALIIQAAEATTKQIRRVILTITAYMLNISAVLSTGIIYKYDTNESISIESDSRVTTILSYVIFVSCFIALVFNFLFTNDTITFLLARGEETKAFKLLTNLKIHILSMLDVRNEFERIRFDFIQESLMNRSLRARHNFSPLTTMSFIRILNLLFTNIPMTLLLIWPTENDREEKKPVSPIVSLLTIQLFRILCGICITLSANKHRFNRFVYKISFLCGWSLFLTFVIYLIVGTYNVVYNWIFFPLLLMFGVSFLMLPLPLDVLKLVQTADSYSRCKNTWLIAFALFVEHSVHIMLILQMDFMFDLEVAMIIIGGMMIYVSFWLLKHMPNECAIHPITIAIVSRYPFKQSEIDDTIHI